MNATNSTPADDVREAVDHAVREALMRLLAEWGEGESLADDILAAFEVRPHGAVTEDERAAINVALIRGLPLWVSAIDEGHARKALLDGIVHALEAAREVQP